MVKRISIRLDDGDAIFRISPPGLDVDEISSDDCLLSETWASPMQIIQSGVVALPSGQADVPIMLFVDPPIPHFYTVLSGTEPWKIPVSRASTNTYSATIQYPSVGIMRVASPTNGVNVVYMLMKRT